MNCLNNTGLVYSQKFTKEQRLLCKRDYISVLRHTARSVLRDGPILLCWAKSSSPFSRLGLVVAKKHIRSSVMRNRLKRIARESFRLSLSVRVFPADMVVRVIHPLGDSDWDALHSLFTKLYEGVRG